MIIKYAILLAIVLVLAVIVTWAFLPPRYLPGNRARHLRLHPGKGFAHIFSLWLRWGRLAALRRSGRAAGGRAPGLPAGAARPEPDPGQDGDGRQQPRGEHDVHGEAEDSQGHDGDKGKGDDPGHGDRSPFTSRGLRSSILPSPDRRSWRAPGWPLTAADPASAVVVFMLQGCRPAVACVDRDQPGSHPAVHPRGHQGHP
jgi:hypothetical protein